MIQTAYQHTFSSITSYWIAFDGSYISLGVNEVLPKQHYHAKDSTDLRFR